MRKKNQIQRQKNAFFYVRIMNLRVSLSKPKGLIKYMNSKNIMHEEDEQNGRLTWCKGGICSLTRTQSEAEPRVHSILKELLKWGLSNRSPPCCCCGSTAPKHICCSNNKSNTPKVIMKTRREMIGNKDQQLKCMAFVRHGNYSSNMLLFLYFMSVLFY